MKNRIMNLKISMFLTVFLAVGSLAQAQQVAALHSSGNTTMFYSNNALVDAYNAAASGDTIYLSGGSFNVPSSFAKGLAIFGAGFYPDSTNATLPTILNNNIQIVPNADGIHFEGIEFNQTIRKNYRGQYLTTY